MNYLLFSFLLIQIYIVFVTPLPSSTTKDKEACCPDTITLNTKGWAVRRWGSRLGVFSLLGCDERGNGIYEHALKHRFYLYRLSLTANPNNEWQKDVWMLGDKVGNNFGWIMHMYCDHECPSDCPNRLWRYWNGTTRGHGNWERDEHFKVLDADAEDQKDLMMKYWMLDLGMEISELSQKFMSAHNETSSKLDSIENRLKTNSNFPNRVRNML